MLNISISEIPYFRHNIGPLLNPIMAYSLKIDGLILPTPIKIFIDKILKKQFFYLGSINININVFVFSLRYQFQKKDFFIITIIFPYQKIEYQRFSRLTVYPNWVPNFVKNALLLLFSYSWFQHRSFSKWYGLNHQQRISFFSVQMIYKLACHPRFKKQFSCTQPG